jgi:superfamily II DNA or RNA helicase
MEGYPGIKEETREFLANLLSHERTPRLWRHQEEAILRSIYCYEILNKRNLLLNIVTGGGKTLIIASVIAWLRFAHGITKFLILTPNLIVKDRLETDFKDGRVFNDWHLLPEHAKNLVNDLGLHVMESGAGPQGMLESGIILGNIQQFYQTNISGQRNLGFIMSYVSQLAIFNDEAHNTPAEEYSRILEILSPKCAFRLDTTATPDRADGQQPDSEMIYNFSISDALKERIVKNIVVYEPQVKALELTYTNFKTGAKKVVTELDQDFKEAEQRLKPFQWILDPEPMRKQIAIALARLDEQRERAKERYKPLLFVVTMSVKEAERAQKMLEDQFNVRTLLVTEEAEEAERQEAREIGSKNSPYNAVVSVLMLREGWDVREVSVVLLLRKFGSPVYGQQVIGRGLRRIIRDSNEPEILAVVDHPMLEHDWLWRLVNVSSIRQGILPGDKFSPEEDLPIRPKLQSLVRPEFLIKIPEPKYDSRIDFPGLNKAIPEDSVERDWQTALQSVTYDREDWQITRTRIEQIRGKHLGSKRLEVLTGPGSNSNTGSNLSVEKPKEALQEDLKREVLDATSALLFDAGFGGLMKARLYGVIMDHISSKLLSGKTLADASLDDIEFAIHCVPQVRKNFSKTIVAGILEGEKGA